MNTPFQQVLKLTDAEEDAVVAFMRTLSDGFEPDPRDDDDDDDRRGGRRR